MNIKRTNIGKYAFYHDADSEPGGKQLSHGIDYEQHIRKELERLLPDARCFFDIGANAGIHSVNAKDINPDIHVVAVEVSYKNIGMICKTCEENKFKKFDILPIAINSYSGVIGIGDVDNSCCSINNIVSFDNLWPCHPLSMFNLPHPDVIKIDVEGMELSALIAIRHLIEWRIKLPTILIEYCPVNMAQFGVMRHEPLEYLQNLGYKFTMLDYLPGIRRTFDSYVGILEYFDSLNLVITDIMAHA